MAVIYVCGMMMNSLDSTMVTVAFATLSHEFGRSPAEMRAVLIGYLVSLAVFIPASGWLGDRFGTKRAFLVALGLFTTGSLLCGISSSFGQLVLFRIVQGAGGGLLTPVGMAMLYRTFPPEERVRISRILMFALVIGPASGPLVGGIILERLEWNWIFYVNVPVGIAALLFGILCLEEHREKAPGRFDLAGFLLGGAGLALAMLALNEGPTYGWTSPRILSVGVAGGVLLAIFVVVELRLAEPMVQLRLLTNRLFGASVLVSFFSSAAFLGTLFLTPLYLQEARGFSPFESGSTTFPEAIGVVVSTQFVARLYPRVGPRRLMAAGMIGIAIVAVLLSQLPLEGSAWVVRGLMFLLGVCMAYIFLPNQAASMATISREATGRASTIFSVQRQVGSAVGIAVIGSVLAIMGATTVGADGATLPNVDAYRAAFLVAAVLAVIGAAMALRVPDEDAAATMVPQVRRVVRQRPVAAKSDS